MIKKYQYCFTNISATKAWIFTKFNVVLNYYLVSLSFKFHEDLCINARTRVVKARTYVFSTIRARGKRLQENVVSDRNWMIANLMYGWNVF